jgi:Protein of unknown function with HXXEE motif
VTSDKIGRPFLFLTAAQAAHSVEEYVFKLYEVFAPARLVSGLLSTDLKRGFVIANATLVAFGLWCYVARVRRLHPSALVWCWFWIALETANGVAHLTIAALRGEFFPGMITAPLLLASASYLAFCVLRSGQPRMPDKPT